MSRGVALCVLALTWWLLGGCASASVRHAVQVRPIETVLVEVPSVPAWCSHAAAAESVVVRGQRADVAGSLWLPGLVPAIDAVRATVVMHWLMTRD